MSGMFKTDDAYGYHISLEEDRSLQAGHDVGLTSEDTDVTALKKIFDSYIDTSSPDKTAEFIDHKLDFSVTVLDSMYLVLRDKVKEANEQFEEVERELGDISHRMSKTYLSGKTFTSEEKVDMFDKQQELLVRRRNLKDSLTVMRVLMENFEKSRNFILGMNRRQYSAKSNRFKEDPEYSCESKEKCGGSISTTIVSTHVDNEAHTPTPKRIQN